MDVQPLHEVSPGPQLRPPATGDENFLASRRASWHSDPALSCFFLLPAVVILLQSSSGAQQWPRPLHPYDSFKVTGDWVESGQTAVKTAQSEPGPSAYLPPSPVLSHWGGLSPGEHGLGHGGSPQQSWRRPADPAPWGWILGSKPTPAEVWEWSSQFPP